VAPEPILSVREVGVQFGGVQAVAGCSFEVAAGQVVGLIGPNGAGKTSLFNAISGIVRNYQGEIRIAGHSLRALPAHRVAALGLARTFQNIRLFRSLTVADNVLVGEHRQIRENVFDSAFHTPRFHREESAALSRVESLLEFVGLQHLDPQALPGSLPYGDQRRLEIARALAGKPRLLLLDEPAAGMNTAESRSLGSLVRRIRESGVTVLLVEHDMRVVMSVCDRVVVLNFGRLIAQGAPSEVQANPEVVAAYLGKPPE
jgi:branched-chain amino acid transport system ATP-binding protein